MKPIGRLTQQDGYLCVLGAHISLKQYIQSRNFLILLHIKEGGETLWHWKFDFCLDFNLHYNWYLILPKEQLIDNFSALRHGNKIGYKNSKTISATALFYQECLH